LGEYKYIGFDVYIKNISFVKNTSTLGKKTYTIDKLINHYKSDFYVVIDIKK